MKMGRVQVEACGVGRFDLVSCDSCGEGATTTTVRRRRTLRRLRHVAVSSPNDGWRWLGRPSTRRHKQHVFTQILVDVLYTGDLATVRAAYIDPPFDVCPLGVTVVALTQMATR